MPTMTGGQALMRSLYLEGVRVIFGLPGVQLYHALDALNDVPGIRLITTRHEQATTYMADGYARASGGVGTALMVPGPGLLNASAGLSTAYSASSPVLVVCGQIERDLIGVDRGMLHEVNDQQDAIRPITKHVRRIMTTEETPEAVHEAFRQLTTGRPRPVEIEMPPETMADQGTVTLLEAEGYPRPAASDEQVAEAARILAGARRPLIWAGGGVIASEGSAALVRLAERLQAPVITTAEGKGAIDDRHPLALGALRLRKRPGGEVRSELRRHPGRGQPDGVSPPGWTGSAWCRLTSTPMKWAATGKTPTASPATRGRCWSRLTPNWPSPSRRARVHHSPPRPPRCANNGGRRRCVPSRRSRCWRRCARRRPTIPSWCRA